MIPWGFSLKNLQTNLMAIDEVLKTKLLIMLKNVSIKFCMIFVDS